MEPGARNGAGGNGERTENRPRREILSLASFMSHKLLAGKKRAATLRGEAAIATGKAPLRQRVCVRARCSQVEPEQVHTRIAVHFATTP